MLTLNKTFVNLEYIVNVILEMYVLYEWITDLSVFHFL